MKATVFVGTSLDGFIARTGGSYDFLPTDGGEPHGYEELMASVDAVVMGRKTYESVLELEEWPYEGKRVFVLSSQPLAQPPAGVIVQRLSGAVRSIAAELEARNVEHAYVDGGITVQGFLRAGLIQRLIITRVPVLIGAGIPLFGALERDVQLRHIATQSYGTGLVKSEYEVVG